MKSVNFQRNKSMIRVVNEKGGAKKQRNWDRIMYLCLMSLFLVFIVYYLISKYAFIHANGHVIIESTHIRLTDDARILDLRVNEGDSIQKGDTLFCYAVDNDRGGEGTGLSIGNLEMSTSDNWWMKEAYGLQKKILLNRVSISENNALINTYRGELKRLTNEVILDVLPKTRLEYVQNEILRLSSENKKLETENSEMQRLSNGLAPTPDKKRLSAKQVAMNTGNSVEEGTENTFSDEWLSEPKYFRSPVSGVATRVFTHTYETALKSEDIMTIHKTQPAFIKAYFDQEDLRHFKVGDQFTVKFPDGTESEGVLRRFYVATYTLPEEFQKKYEPTTRSIAGDIYPLDSMEIKKWRVFYKMSVDITKTKF